MRPLPPGAPAQLGEAFGKINAVTAPTIDDMKLMVLLEASAQTAYEGLAAQAPTSEIADLLRANGREEMAHAHRVAQVIEKLTGEAYPPPVAAENPYVTDGPGRPLDARVLEGLIVAENNGNDLYETWAASLSNAECAALLRLNGREEIRHGERAAQALALLTA